MFDKAQEKAIRFENGSALILAGPGSGKTTVITHRIKRLIEEEKVSPEDILVVTFTKAAADEMQQRFLYLMNNESGLLNYPVIFGTFHSIFYRILRCYNNSSYSILSERKKNDILKEITIRLKLECNNMTEFVNCISSEISVVKGNNISVYEYQSQICNSDKFVQIYKEYEKSLDEENTLDFDDMLGKCYKLLKVNKEVRKIWQNKFKYILIDEFQDINSLQYENMKILAFPENNIFVVGDDDQSIYGFRGSKPEMMFKFKEDYSNCEEILLNINYRSDEEIVRLSTNLIKHNEKRFSKDITACKNKKNSVDIRQFQNQFEELNYLSKLIKQYNLSGIKYEEMAILIRNNSQLVMIRNHLIDNRIVSVSKKGSSNIYNSDVGKDVIAYVKSAYSNLDSPLRENEALMRIINKPMRYISRQVLSEKGISFNELYKLYSHNKEIMDNIRELRFHLNMIKGMSPISAIIYIRNGCKYETYLREYAKEKRIRIKNVMDSIEEIQNEASQFERISEWISYMEENSQIKDSNKESEGINIITMHGSKGLEFKVVFILDVNQGLLPSVRAIRQNEVEEERRVFYVAMTRAKDYLHIFSVKANMGNTMEISQFVGEALQFND